MTSQVWPFSFQHLLASVYTFFVFPKNIFGERLSFRGNPAIQRHMPSRHYTYLLRIVVIPSYFGIFNSLCFRIHLILPPVRLSHQSLCSSRNAYLNYEARCAVSTSFQLKNRLSFSDPQSQFHRQLHLGML